MTGDIIVGLDVGTTSVKVALFSLDGSVRLAASKEYPLLNPEPGWHVQRPEDITRGVLQALRDAVSQVDPARIMGIAVSSAMHGLMGLDQDLSPVTEIITWADSRAVDQAAQLREHSTAYRLHNTSGTPTQAMSPLVKLRWFADERPDVLRSTRYWIGLKDWVLLLLTGQVVTELSTASGSGLLDIHERTWNPEALEIAEISEGQLPRIHSTTASLPLIDMAAREIGLSAGLPVVLGAGDGPLGNLGTGAMEDGEAGLSIGTSGAIRTALTKPGVAPGLFCYALTDDVWIAGGALSNGGMVQRWLGDTYAPGEDDEQVAQRAARVTAGCDGLVMLPYLVSERALGEESDVRGAFLHVRKSHTPDHFIRAGIEGVAYQVLTILRRLREIQRVDQIRATGGVFKSALWREVVAGMLNRPVTVVGAVEGSALGAAILGLHSLDVVQTLPEGYELLRDKEPEEPVVVSPAVKEAYQRMRDRVPQLLEVYGDMAERLG